MSDDAALPVDLPPDFDPVAALLEIDVLVRRRPAPGSGDWKRWHRFGASSERGRKLLDQLELQLEELEAAATEDEAALDPGQEGLPLRPRAIRRKPVCGPLPAHLLSERVVPSSTECPCCRGKLAKLGEDVTETLEVVPRQWKVVQTVRERFTCRACDTIEPCEPCLDARKGRQAERPIKRGSCRVPGW